MSALLFKYALVPLAAWWLGWRLIIWTMEWRGYGVTDVTEYTAQIVMVGVVLLGVAISWFGEL